MIRFNATVKTGFVNRAGEYVLGVHPDKGAPVQIRHFEALPEGKRVLLVAGKIEATQ